MNEPSPEAIKAAEEIFATCVPAGELVGVYEAAKVIDRTITGVVVEVLPTYPVPRVSDYCGRCGLTKERCECKPPFHANSQGM